MTQPVAAPDEIASGLYRSGSAFGNDDLWVGGLGERGIIRADEGSTAADGAVDWQFGWWRLVEGRVTVSGRRLNAESPPLRSLPAGDYGPSGLQLTPVRFPAPGCWEVTGSLEGASGLTFIVYVLGA